MRQGASKRWILAFYDENYEGCVIGWRGKGAIGRDFSQELQESIEHPALCLAQSGRLALKLSRPACSV